VVTHPYLEASGPIAIAHRGGAGESPENTIEAFRAADALGYRYLETDAQLTKDGVVIAFHDSKIDRVSGTSGKISEWSWDDLQEVPIGECGRLSTVSQLLAEFPNSRFNLDAKSDAVLLPLLEVIDHARAFDRVCIGSFSGRRLARARALHGDLCTSFGPMEVLNLFARSRGIRRPRSSGYAVQAPVTLRGVRVITQRLVDIAHDEGLVVHAWTIDDVDEMNRLLDLGVDGIMTDRPSDLRRVMEQRGIWV
jgi:glycerophosphoryl diester phosphodiesterase